MEIFLRDMRVGQAGKVLGIRKGDAVYRQKLLAMGLTPGTRFSVTRLAPLGDPVEIRVRGFALSLRKDEADALMVEAVAG
jgi:ferrous iron transport protein A